jgi:hypothetical protein
MTEQHSHRSHPEQVVLEIGADLGALVVYTDARVHGTEIEISLSGDDGDRSHKEVLNRPVGGRPTYAAVFDRLVDGSYTLWVSDVAVARGVAITGGSITELDWCGAELPVRPLAGHHTH